MKPRCARPRCACRSHTRYDANGNTTGDGTHTYQYSQADRLATVDSGATATYTYDGDGRRVINTASGMTTYFFYDAAGRLLTETVAASGIGKDYLYLLDAPIARLDWAVSEIDLGNVLRVEKSSPNVRLDWTLYAAASNRYVVRRKQVVDPSDKTFDGNSVIVAINDPTRTYDDPILNDGNRYDYRVFRQVLTETLSFYHCDHLGTPLAMTDTSATVVWRAEHLPFGGISSLPVSSVVNNLRLPGQYFDAEHGLHQNWFRTYYPRIGRYVEPDPLARVANDHLYVYVHNLPTRLVDPWGLCCTNIDRTRELLVVLNVLTYSQGRNFWTQVCSGRIAQSPGGCGWNADGLVIAIRERRLKCWNSERVDAGPRWLGRLLGADFTYSRIIPHSFVRLSSIDQCNPCEMVRDVAADNYDGLPVLAPISGRWAPL